MLLSDLLAALDARAPFSLAQAGDNCGLLVGDKGALVRRVLASLELTEAVLEESVATGCDTVLTHHPLLYAPLRSLVESDPRERLVRRLVREDIGAIACHTNLDAAAGGIADITAIALGLTDTAPLEPAAGGRYKLVGFVPEDAIESVAAAVFSAGAGRIGEYRDCAFSSSGTGWFTAGDAAHPTVGTVGKAERVPEVRWESVVPRWALDSVLRAFIAAHPYEQPAFDLYPVEDVLPGVGLGRFGWLPRPLPVADVAAMVASTFGLERAEWSGDGSRMVSRVGVVPGSGGSLIDQAATVCDVLVTGDLSYHDAERAETAGISVIAAPHGDLEWWAFKRWAEGLAKDLRGSGVEIVISGEWRSPWTTREVDGVGDADRDGRIAGAEGASLGEDRAGVRIWIDGGSRGNPGPSAIGVVVEDQNGTVVETRARCIGMGTNNIAEYRALLAALEIAEELGAQRVEVVSDSELLVKQMKGEYRVKNQGLKDLFEEAIELTRRFERFSVRHVRREDNARADALVNQALDDEA